MITTIRKRDGRTAYFDINKIASAITKHLPLQRLKRTMANVLHSQMRLNISLRMTALNHLLLNRYRIRLKALLLLTAL